MMMKYEFTISLGAMWRLCRLLVLGLLPATQAIAELQAIHQLEMFNDTMGVHRLPKHRTSKHANALTSKVSKESVTHSKKSPTSTTDDGSENTGAKSPLSDEEVISEEAFKQVKQKMFPLTEDQILDLHRAQRSNQIALQSPEVTPPRPAVSTQIVKLDPGSTPSIIRIGLGFISSVVFLDSTGAPWPIAAYDLGDPSAFNIQWDKTGSNTLMIQSKKLYTYGNMAIKLQGMNTPVMLTLVPGQQVIDYRVDMRVMGLGPNAESMPIGLDLPAVESSDLMKLLDDVKPPNAKRLDVVGGPASAWLDGNTMYVRTRLTILSPGWLSMLSSADGMNAYKLTKSPVLLVSWHGKVMQLKIEGLTHE